MSANFQTGPVAVMPEVRAAFSATPVPHRDLRFLESMWRTRSTLMTLVNASHVVLMMGSGTLANDAVAAQLGGLGPGLILSNGEFGERLVDHARRWNLRFETAEQAWGQGFDWTQVRHIARQAQPRWIWAVLTETSTGVSNSLQELRELSNATGADLCLDAVSAIGLMPVDLNGVRFATAVSGKGLAAYPGLAAVFHSGSLAIPARVPRYLDLASYEAADGVPYTHSSNLVAALECSLIRTRWLQKFESVQRGSRLLRAGLRRHLLAPLASDEDSAPGVVTLPLPASLDASNVARALEADGYQLAFHSRYLKERNWLQVALMGEFDEAALLELPDVLARHVERLSSRSRACDRSSLPHIVADAIDGGAVG